MFMKKVLVAAIVALILGASFPAGAQQQSGRVAGMSPAMAAAAGLGLVIAGVLIADEIGSSGSDDLFPPVQPDPDEPDEPDLPPETAIVTIIVDGTVVTTVTNL